MSESLNYALVALAASAIATTVGSTLSTAVPEMLKGRISTTLEKTMDRVAVEPPSPATAPSTVTIAATKIDPCNLQAVVAPLR
jgi:hypothetical protein